MKKLLLTILLNSVFLANAVDLSTLTTATSGSIPTSITNVSSINVGASLIPLTGNSINSIKTISDNSFAALDSGRGSFAGLTDSLSGAILSGIGALPAVPSGVSSALTWLDTSSDPITSFSSKIPNSVAISAEVIGSAVPSPLSALTSSLGGAQIGNGSLQAFLANSSGSLAASIQNPSSLGGSGLADSLGVSNSATSIPTSLNTSFQKTSLVSLGELTGSAGFVDGSFFSGIPLVAGLITLLFGNDNQNPNRVLAPQPCPGPGCKQDIKPTIVPVVPNATAKVVDLNQVPFF